MKSPAESKCSRCVSCCNAHRNICPEHDSKTTWGNDNEIYCEIPLCKPRSTSKYAANESSLAINISVEYETLYISLRSAYLCQITSYTLIAVISFFNKVLGS